MNGQELLTRKYTKGDNIEYKSDSIIKINKDIERAKLIYINYEQQSIIIINITTNLYEFHALKNIQIK